MMTRGTVQHSYGVYPRLRERQAGLVKQKVTKGHGVQTWAVSRPIASPYPFGAPHYLNTPANQRGTVNVIVRQGAPKLMIPPYHMMRDPSDPATWQRVY
jgi:hypothetical protein